MGAPTYRSGRMARAGAAVAPVVVAAVAMLIALVMHGCGENASSDCTTKATCPDDAAGPEVSVTDTAAAEVGPGDGGDGGSGCNGVCASPPPMGWQGPIALYTGSAMGGPLPSPPVCPAPYSNDAVDGNSLLIAPAAQCGCTCGAVTGADCSTGPTWFLYADSNCATVPCANVTTPLMTTTCQTNGCNSPLAFKAVPGPPNLQGASCAPDAGTMLPPWSWQAVVRGCGYTGPSDPTGCIGSSLCVPAPSAPFGASVCIYAPGEQACPPGPYSTGKPPVFTSETDTRSCGTCTCAGPSNVTCGVSGNLGTYTLASCMSPSGSFPVDALCHAAAGTVGVEGSVTSAGVVGGSCAPTSAGAMGAVTPMGATTVCCAP